MKLLVDGIGVLMEMVMLRYFFNIVFEKIRYSKMIHFIWYAIIGVLILMSSVYVESGLFKTLNCVLLVTMLQILMKTFIMFQ